LAIAGSAQPAADRLAPLARAVAPYRLRLGIARDEAFSFHYADNLEALQRAGAELVPFSPLNDRRLADDLDAVYLGGGYPELHAARLAANEPMLADLRRFADSGRCIYAECGGLMYLGRGLTARDGTRYPMADVLPIETQMLERLKTLGYTEVTWEADCGWGTAGQTARGHEFHYSEITADGAAADGWQRAYAVRRRQAPPGREGFVKHRVLAGYAHLHWASRPESVARFVSYCENRS
jgi:cobyrinic acid a,c-diamide synthase